MKTYILKRILLLTVAFCIISCGSETEKVAENTVKTEATKKTKANQNIPINKKAPNKAKPTIKNNRPTPEVAKNYKAKNDGWLINFEEAKAESKKTGKPIMANFTGSDWCGWCKKLDKTVFHQPGFAEWADKNVILLEVDFPRRFRVPNEVAQQNNGLKQALGVRGFPTIWLFDLGENDKGETQINALGKTGYTKTLAEFQQKVEGFLKAKKG